MNRGKFILVIGPTGSGKGTLMRHALARFPQLSPPQSYTTRARRADKIENTYYTFISEEEFKSKIEKDEFLEWAEFSGSYYGTLRQEVEDALASGKVIFKEMDLQGVRQVREKLPKSELLSVFVDGGSWEELKRRALLRGPLTPEALEMRHARYLDEMAYMPEADVVVENPAGKAEEAQAAFEAVILKALSDVEHS